MNFELLVKKMRYNDNYYEKFKHPLSYTSVQHKVRKCHFDTGSIATYTVQVHDDQQIHFVLEL